MDPWTGTHLVLRLIRWPICYLDDSLCLDHFLDPLRNSSNCIHPLYHAVISHRGSMIFASAAVLSFELKTTPKIGPVGSPYSNIITYARCSSIWLCITRTRRTPPDHQSSVRSIKPISLWLTLFCELLDASVQYIARISILSTSSVKIAPPLHALRNHNG